MNSLRVGGGVQPRSAIYVAISALALLAASVSLAATPEEMAQLRSCLSIDNKTKERIDCYDAVIRPAPFFPPPLAKVVDECRFIDEKDVRLLCFNRFVATTSAPNPPARTMRLSNASRSKPSKPVTSQKQIAKGQDGCWALGKNGYRRSDGTCASHRGRAPARRRASGPPAPPSAQSPSN